jgi:hypothetical protein
MNMQQKSNMPYATDGLTDMTRFHHLQQWRSSFGIRKMPKIWIAFLLMAPCLFAQGDEKHKDEKKGNSGIRHEESKPESGPIVHNYTLGNRGLIGHGEKGEIVLGTANVTVNPDGSWNFSGQLNDNGTLIERRGKVLEESYGPNQAFCIVFALKSSEGTVIAFKHEGTLKQDNPQSYSWETQGNNRTIKDNFKAFAKSHDWYVTWVRVVLPQPGSSGGGPDVGTILADVAKVLGPLAAVAGI